MYAPLAYKPVVGVVPVVELVNQSAGALVENPRCAVAVAVYNLPAVGLPVSP